MLRKLIYEAGARMRNPSLMEQFDFLKRSDRWERAQLDYYQLEKMKVFWSLLISILLFIGRCSKRLDSFHRK